MAAGKAEKRGGRGPGSNPEVRKYGVPEYLDEAIDRLADYEGPMGQEHKIKIILRNARSLTTNQLARIKAEGRHGGETALLSKANDLLFSLKQTPDGELTPESVAAVEKYESAESAGTPKKEITEHSKQDSGGEFASPARVNALLTRIRANPKERSALLKEVVMDGGSFLEPQMKKLVQAFNASQPPGMVELDFLRLVTLKYDADGRLTDKSLQMLSEVEGDDQRRKQRRQEDDVLAAQRRRAREEAALGGFDDPQNARLFRIPEIPAEAQRTEFISPAGIAGLAGQGVEPPAQLAGKKIEQAVESVDKSLEVLEQARSMNDPRVRRAVAELLIQEQRGNVHAETIRYRLKGARDRLQKFGGKSPEALATAGDLNDLLSRLEPQLPAAPPTFRVRVTNFFRNLFK